MLNGLNIIDIHNDILKTFDLEEQKLPELERRILKLEEISKNNINERMDIEIKSQLNEIKNEYNIIKTGQKKNFYLLKVTSLLNLYLKELSKPIEIDFMKKTKKINTEEIKKIQHQFINIVKDFYPKLIIEPSDEPDDNKDNKCDDCGIELTDQYTCFNCGLEKENLQLTYSYKDTDRIHITSKYTYDRRVHFRDCINQFQGKQNSTIKPEVYQKLIKQFNLHGLVREEDLPKKMKYEKITKKHVALFLKEINYTKHYEDINLIYHNITGNELDDISHLEDILMNDFDKLSELYNEQYIKKKKIDRKNFINTQYVLYQLLKRHKYPCTKNDFNFLKTIERKGFHDEICSDLFKQLNWNFSPLF